MTILIEDFIPQLDIRIRTTELITEVADHTSTGEEISIALEVVTTTEMVERPSTEITTLIEETLR